MTAAAIHLAGERLMLDPMGALFWPKQRLLAVSDLHLEKGSSFARKGMLLPPWDTHATIDRLALLLRRWSPETVIALGRLGGLGVLDLEGLWTRYENLEPLPPEE